MKKIFTLIILLWGLNSMVLAQNTAANEPVLSDRSSFQTYLQAGMVVGDLRGTQIDFKLERDSFIEKRTGVSIGAGFRSWLSNAAYLRFGGHYTQKGAEIRGGGFLYSDKAFYDYLNADLNFGLTKRSSLNKLGIEAGASINLQLAKDENLGSGLSNVQKLENKAIIPALMLGVFYERTILKGVDLHFMYQYYWDQSYFFKRFHKNVSDWDYTTSSPVYSYSDYDMFHKGSILSISLFFDVNTTESL